MKCAHEKTLSLDLIVELKSNKGYTSCVVIECELIVFSCLVCDEVRA